MNRSRDDDQRALRVVILGGGFGGLYVAKALQRAPVQVSLVDRRNFHLFQPLLYQVATGGLNPGDIATPLRFVLRRQVNTHVILGEAVDLDAAAKRLILRDGAIDYDILVVATGSRHHYFGHPEWEAIAPGLKTIEDATAMRHRILVAFEKAEREPDPDRRRAWLTFVIVGGGPTGVELAGTLAEIAHHTLRHDYRAIDPRSTRILLLDAGDRILSTYEESLSQRAVASLARLGVEVRTGELVSDVDANGVTVTCGDRRERVTAHTVLWAAGVLASPLGRVLKERTGVELDRGGRVEVLPDLTVPGHPEIYVIGDLAHGRDAAGNSLPGVAPVAMQEAKYVAQRIEDLARGRPPGPPFQYRDPGQMATIGRGAAVAQFRRLKFSGYGAWLAWLAIHLTFLIEFENRMLVLMQWAWNYITWNRGARLITGSGSEIPPPAGSAPAP